MKIAILGCGTMSSALIISMRKFDKQLEVWTYTPSRFRAEALAKKINGNVLEDVKDLSSFDLVFLGCKPQQFETLCQQVGGLHDRQTDLLHKDLKNMYMQVSSLCQFSEMVLGNPRALHFCYFMISL